MLFKPVLELIFDKCLSLPVDVLASSRHRSFLPQSRDKDIRLIGSSELNISVNASANSYLSLYVTPVLDLQAVQAGCCIHTISASAHHHSKRRSNVANESVNNAEFGTAVQPAATPMGFTKL